MTESYKSYNDDVKPPGKPVFNTKFMLHKEEAFKASTTIGKDDDDCVKPPAKPDFVTEFMFHKNDWFQPSCQTQAS